MYKHSTELRGLLKHGGCVVRVLASHVTLSGVLRGALRGVIDLIAVHHGLIGIHHHLSLRHHHRLLHHHALRCLTRHHHHHRASGVLWRHHRARGEHHGLTSHHHRLSIHHVSRLTTRGGTERARASGSVSVGRGVVQLHQNALRVLHGLRTGGLGLRGCVRHCTQLRCGAGSCGRGCLELREFNRVQEVLAAIVVDRCVGDSSGRDRCGDRCRGTKVQQELGGLGHLLLWTVLWLLMMWRVMTIVVRVVMRIMVRIVMGWV